MVISTIAFKVAFSAMIVLFTMFILDEANGTSNSDDSPLWIAIPGIIAGITLVVAFIVGAIALVWTL